MKYKLLIIWVLIVELVGCGGSTGSSGAQTSANTPPNVDTKYSGNRNAATLTIKSAAQYLELIFSGNQSSFQTLATNTSNLNASIANRVINTKQVMAVSLDEKDNCDTGYVWYHGQLNGQAVGAVDVQFEDCKIKGTTYSGSGTLYILDATNTPTNLIIAEDTLYYNKVSVVTDKNATFQIEGTVNYVTPSPSAINTTTSNLLLTDKVTGVSMMEELTLEEDTVQNYPFSQVYHGRIYHSQLGYVDVETPLPLLFNGNRLESNTPDYPNIDGTLRLTGIGAAHMDMNVVRLDANSTVPDSVVSLRLYNDAGDIADAVRFNVDSVENGVLSNMNDSDSDGMPDGWELFYGLNPASSADKQIDFDGDGVSNYDEFVQAGDPNDSAVSSRIVDLYSYIDVSYYDNVTPIVGNSLDIPLGTEIYIGARAINMSTTYPGKGINMVVTISPGLEWYGGGIPIATQDSCHFNDSNQYQVICQFDKVVPSTQTLQGSIGTNLTVVGTQTGPYTITLDMTSRTDDIIMSNNKTQYVGAIK